MGGPSVGGLLVQALSAPAALAADAVSFIASALALGAIRPAEPATEASGRGLVSSGMRFLLGSPVLRAALAATATVNLGDFVFNALVILYLTRSLGLQPGLLGVVLGCGSVGSLAGSLLTARLSRRIGVGPTCVLGCVLFPLPLALVPLAGGPRPLVIAMVAAAYFGAGLGVMALDIAFGSVTAALVPARLRSRVAGAYMLVNYGVRPVGSVLGGLLGTAIGLRPTLALAVAAATLGFLWLLPSPMLRLRELPEAAEG
jgi:MFS family permease